LLLSIVVGIISTIYLFQPGITKALILAGKALISELTIVTVLAFYTITFLQRMLGRGQFIIAQKP